MGFPAGYTEVFFPNLFLHTLSLLGFVRSFVFVVFRFVGLSDFLEPELVWVHTMDRTPVSAVLIREILPDTCAVCMYELEGGDEIRWLKNCRHVFHRACVDRWMDHDHKTCPLCRTSFVPDEMQNEFNQRLWAATGLDDFYTSGLEL